ncbi:hypothetical protein I3842_03G273200 [Carya illinoinensis]|uniref:Uncharacterized protein n=1 Tax=Carya illinoinensis TaxID=32201 RepID=A0A922FLZ0_CARIL|nr:hypothetical protein I3842_03G273200 [Carya illinoinensis]
MKQTVEIKVSMDGHKCIFGELDGQKACSKALKIAVGLEGDNNYHHMHSVFYYILLLSLIIYNIENR